MSPIQQGFYAGALFGGLTVAIMLPMPFPDKRTALLAAFLNRFGIGLLIPFVRCPLPGWLTGLAVGLLLSLPSALLTKAPKPILIAGAVGGAVIGGLTLGLR